MQIGRFTFAPPKPIGWQGVDLYGAGIYAILSGGSQWTVVYIGQSGDVGERVGPTHHKWTCWQRFPNLHVSFLSMPNSTERERLAIEGELIKQFNPPCNG